MRLKGGPAALAAARHLGDRYRVFGEVARRVAPTDDAVSVAVRARVLAGAYGVCCARGIVAAPERRGARHALAYLKGRGVRLWLLSATPMRDLPPLLRRRGLLRWFDGVIGSPVAKEEGLRKILTAARVDRRELLMVGDGLDDQAAARAAGVPFVAVIAENRVPARGRFAMRDLTRLGALVNELDCKPQVRA